MRWCRAIQQARPNVFWENCENGGNMMTFNMVKSYVTSITNDASGSLPSRQAVYGATYPFPPRYAERYMPESDGFTPVRHAQLPLRRAVGIDDAAGGSSRRTRLAS